ncbi:MAG: tRNA epoxyqueuosine(34) reductase QueG [Luteitalea sp.]|nr:tRNA epoxyqueuosine(34) reductase QueG [Luteitalea sp.]
MLTAAAIKSRASEIGFDLCGIAPAEAFPELGRFREWLARGYAGEMQYLARTAHKRADPHLLLRNARSVIVTGTIYNVDRPYSATCGPGEARIARYGWGDDYHDVIGQRQHLLLGWMKDAAGELFDAVSYVDTGPVQEKVFAARAGLGWIGKNTCVINQDVGSWIFLGVILCGLEIEPDAPALDHCGSCTRCLEACPTGALVEPYVLDATRCISYLTIEVRGAIPRSQRPDVGEHVYGCDICQDVCPWNRRAPTSDDPAWLPRTIFDRTRTIDLWRRSDTDLRAALKASAMTRAGLRRFRRNLSVALGNSAGPESEAALCDDDRADAPSLADPAVREHVEWAKGGRARSPNAPD